MVFSFINKHISTSRLNKARTKLRYVFKSFKIFFLKKTLNAKHIAEDLKTNEIETCKTKTQKDENLVLPKE